MNAAPTLGEAALPRLRVLLLCDYDERSAGTIFDHIRSFVEYSRHQYVLRNGRGDLLAGVDLSSFDALIVHYSLVACYDAYLAPATRRRIRTFPGLKAAFVQDDYRFIDRTVEAFAYLRIHALFPLAGPDIIDAVYSPAKLPGVRKVTVLAGYVPEHLAKVEVPRYADRPIDVGYRARKLPAWMGSHTLQKWQIAERFAADAARYDLKIDLSCREEDRIYGQDWIEFVKRCKAMLGTESGASVCDFTGQIQENVERHLQRNPDASFDELRKLYFKDQDRRLMMNVISPRCFEAAALRSLMVMYEGDYSGVLEPWRHYVPLRADHSNMDAVVSVIRDPERAEEIIGNAYREVILSGRYSYRSMVQLVDGVLEEVMCPAMRAANRHPSGQEANHLLPITFEEVRSPSELIPPPPKPSRVRHAYHGVREWARGVLPAWVWKRLREGKRRGLAIRDTARRLRGFARVDLRLLLPGMRLNRMGETNFIQLADEIVRWRSLLSFFAGTSDSELVVFLSQDGDTLTLTGVPPDAVGLGDDAQMLSDSELHQLLRAARIHRIAWANNDPLGLGLASPFEREFTFAQLSMLARSNPGTLERLILPADGRAWYRRAMRMAPRGTARVQVDPARSTAGAPAFD